MLDEFKRYQQLSFQILESKAAELQAGQSEKEVARALVLEYRAAGVNSFFHLPVVLFGERTALPGDWQIGKFFPKAKTLEEGDSVILDASPIFDGHLVDTSYSFCFGENSVHREMMATLSRFRKDVCDAVNQGQKFKTIAEQVATAIRSAGYEPVHVKHPGEVLGHRAVKLAKIPFNWRIKGFDGLTLSWFLMKGELARRGLGRESPLWNEGSTSDHHPHDGLWLVEPHAGCGPVGAKWEEILVIEDGRARWLDDEPPHVRQWRQIQNDEGYRPAGIQLQA